MDLRIDHVTVAGSRLGPLREAFARLGIETAYGGMHSNGVTHMAAVGFGDGSYVELISTAEPGAPSPVWDRFIRKDAGAAAWAVVAKDIEAEAGRLRAAGIPVEGPTTWRRERPDGVRLEWELAVPGGGPPGSLLPFLIEDRTPRELRVPPGSGGIATRLSGVAATVIGVPRLEDGLERFRRAYGWEPTSEGGSRALGARLAGFADRPAVLAAPEASDGWLAGRLAAFGPAPCAFLLGARGRSIGPGFLADALGEPEPWPTGDVRWIDPERLRGARIGVVAA